MASLVIASSDSTPKLVYSWLNEAKKGEPTKLKVSIQDGEQTKLTLEDGTVIESPNTIIAQLTAIDEKTAGTDGEPSIQADVQQWLTSSSSKDVHSDLAKNVNTHMSGKSFLVGNKLSLADVVVYSRLRDFIAGSTIDEQKNLLNTMRWFNQVQTQLEGNKSLKTANLEAITLDLEALNLGGKKKKEKKGGSAASAKEEKATPIVPSMVDFRVGQIVEVARHEDADSLYVEKIELGEAEPRTVISGLVKHFTLEEMMGRKLVVVCNLKPVSMRGIKSYGMVLCATTPEGKVEFVNPPENSKPGDRIFFEGFQGREPEALLNPKKKIWETIQPGLKTNGECIAGWIDSETNKFHTLQTEQGCCYTLTAVDAPLK